MLDPDAIELAKELDGLPLTLASSYGWGIS
jgi:hypothetical protein